MNTAKMRHQLARTGPAAGVPVQHLGTPMWALLDHPHFIGQPFYVSIEADHRGAQVNAKSVTVDLTGSYEGMVIENCTLWDDAAPSDS